MINFKTLIPATPQTMPEPLILTQSLTSLTFAMFEAAQRLWYKEDATFALTCMCQYLAQHLGWLTSYKSESGSFYDDFFQIVADLEQETQNQNAENLLIMLGTSFDRNDNYSTAEWCAVVICAARKAGYKFDF